MFPTQAKPPHLKSSTLKQHTGSVCCLLFTYLLYNIIKYQIHNDNTFDNFTLHIERLVEKNPLVNGMSAERPSTVKSHSIGEVDCFFKPKHTFLGTRENRKRKYTWQ